MSIGEHTTAHDLYKAVILDHSTNPRNFFRLENPTATATKNNLLCGDEITVFLRLKIANGTLHQEAVLQEISFWGTGCAIMKASASLMTEILRGNTAESASNLVLSITNFLNGDEAAFSEDSPFRSLAGVRSFPSRIKCALLPFQALHDALLSLHPRNS